MTPRPYGILAVDQEASVRGMLKVALRQHGFAVWLAAEGQEALNLYPRHRPSIDVVLLDVRLPGLDGPQTLAALQALNPQIGCCFMSGTLPVTRCRDCGTWAPRMCSRSRFVWPKLPKCSGNWRIRPL